MRYTIIINFFIRFYILFNILFIFIWFRYVLRIITNFYIL